MADEQADNPATAGDAGGSAVALSIALGTAPHNERVAAKVEAFLEQQTEVLRLQKEQMREEESIHRWSLRIRHFSDVMKVAFELSLAFIVVAIAAGVGGALWNAAHDKGVTIQSFSVPPDMAARGLTGEVVAAKLLDHLSSLQEQTNSSRAASSYTNNWGSDIKVQIPDTGVSVGEFYRYLRSWLGHATQISGEVYRTDSGIAVTARAGSETSPTFAGKEADLDKLIQQAAEAVYKSTQPYRYAVYLIAHNRDAEAKTVFEQLIGSGSIEDRAWAYVGLSTIYSNNGDFYDAERALKQAVAVKPGFILAYSDISNNEGNLQHDEDSLQAEERAAAAGDQGEDPSIDSTLFAAGALQTHAFLANDLGDYSTQLMLDRKLEQTNELTVALNSRLSDIAACGQLHDRGCVNAALAAVPPSNDANIKLNRDANLQTADLSLSNWRTALVLAQKMEAELQPLGMAGKVFVDRAENSALAFAQASLGNFESARELIDPSPPDCVVCLRVRGYIDERKRNWDGAAYWYGRAVAAAPSVPFGYADWGRMLLAKKDAAGAIAKFERARAVGPRYADPIEMWGEALMLENRSDLALAKFAEANGLAPHWGRLHLKRGEALLYAGRRNDAKTQFVEASHYELTSEEKVELARVRARV